MRVPPLARLREPLGQPRGGRQLGFSRPDVAAAEERDQPIVVRLHLALDVAGLARRRLERGGAGQRPHWIVQIAERLHVQGLRQRLVLTGGPTERHRLGRAHPVLRQEPPVPLHADQPGQQPRAQATLVGRERGEGPLAQLHLGRALRRARPDVAAGEAERRAREIGARAWSEGGSPAGADPLPGTSARTPHPPRPAVPASSSREVRNPLRVLS